MNNLKLVNTFMFKELNVAGIVNRANELLEHIHALGVSGPAEEKIIAAMKESLELGDHFETASLALVEAELIEQQIRREDEQVPKAGPGWNGGVQIHTVAEHF